jgi:putative transcriptional regulator
VNVIKAKLKVFRAMRDLTQEDLANEIGVTRQTLAFKVAMFFEASLEDIFVYEPE